MLLALLCFAFYLCSYFPAIIFRCSMCLCSHVKHNAKIPISKYQDTSSHTQFLCSCESRTVSLLTHRCCRCHDNSFLPIFTGLFWFLHFFFLFVSSIARVSEPTAANQLNHVHRPIADKTIRMSVFRSHQKKKKRSQNKRVYFSHAPFSHANCPRCYFPPLVVPLHPH